VEAPRDLRGPRPGSPSGPRGCPSHSRIPVTPWGGGEVPRDRIPPRPAPRLPLGATGVPFPFSDSGHPVGRRLGDLSQIFDQ